MAGKRSGTGKRVTYRYVRQSKLIGSRKAAPKKPARKIISETAAKKVIDVGVTIWKLRPPRPTETRLLLLPVLDDSKTRRMWLAERVDVDTIFNAGDLVRLAVESSISGYLYIFDRETYSTDSLGQPRLIFPESPTDDNFVEPGRLFDYPDQKDEWPYLKINPKKANYTGELLTVIISAKPLSNIKTDKEGYVKNIDDLTDLETSAEIEVYSRTDNADRIYSKAESESACGVKARELEREKVPNNPCGVTSRQLTREEPLPQSIYRVNGATDQPALAFVKLIVRQ